MGTLYIVALVVGLGTIAVQLLMSVDKDVGGKDFEFDSSGADIELAGDDHPGHALQPAHAVEHDATDGMGPLAIILSLRFWTFSSMVFGLFGSVLHFGDLASPTLTPILSAVLGVACGWLAAWTFHKLSRAAPNSGAESTDLLGQVGKVMLPPNSQGRAKVRLSIKGQLIDYVATSDDRELLPGASVLVEEVRGDQVHVCLAPAGLEYSDREQ